MAALEQNTCHSILLQFLSYCTPGGSWMASGHLIPGHIRRPRAIASETPVKLSIRSSRRHLAATEALASVLAGRAPWGAWAASRLGLAVPAWSRQPSNG